jgi:hypothetical protein
MKRVEYFPKKMAEREAALVASPASGQDWDRPTARSFTLKGGSVDGVMESCAVWYA